MLPKMSGEKATTESSIIFSQNEMLHSAESPKTRTHRKYAIVSVTGVVVVAAILTAILVGMHLFIEGQKDILKFSRTQDEKTKEEVISDPNTEAQKDILKFSYTQDENTKEDVISDPNTNIVQYHVTNPDYELWTINDFNRDIQVMKIKEARGTNCFVAPLNRTMAVDPSKVTVPSNIKKNNNSTTVSYRASNTPIPDTSFLSKAARDTCQRISTYWMYPSCETSKGSPESFSRQKRDVCCVWVCSGGYCYWVCWYC